MTRTQSAYGLLEKRKNRMLDRLSGWSEAQLSFSPGPGLWSAAQVVDHLVKTEAGILAGLRQDAVQAVSPGERLRAAMVTSMMMFPVRLPMPKAAEARITPAQVVNLPDLSESWASLGERLQVFASRTGMANAGVFRHPVTGWMTARQTLLFLAAHVRHHEYQIARIRSALTAAKL